MRVLHRLRPEEEIVSRGRYHYLRDGRPTGDVETWQITRLPDGSQIVRADMDGRRAQGRNLVTHLYRRPSGAPVWLRVRYFSGRINSAAQYNFEESAVRVARMTTDLLRWQELVEIATNYGIDYHAVVAGDYVWRTYPAEAAGESRLVPVFSPDLWTEGGRVLAGRALRVEVQPLEPETCITPAGEFEGANRFALWFRDGADALAWYDAYGTPLRWLYPAKGYECTLVAYDIIVR